MNIFKKLRRAEKYKDSNNSDVQAVITRDINEIKNQIARNKETLPQPKKDEANLDDVYDLAKEIITVHSESSSVNSDFVLCNLEDNHLKHVERELELTSLIAPLFPDDKWKKRFNNDQNNGVRIKVNISRAREAKPLNTFLHAISRGEIDKNLPFEKQSFLQKLFNPKKKESTT